MEGTMQQTAYKIDYQRIKQEISFDKIVDYLGLKLKRLNDTQYKGDCPLCGSHWAFGITTGNEKRPTGAFNCFSCKSSGDQIELVSRIRGNGPKSKDGCHAAGKELWEQFITVPEPVKQSRTVRTVPMADADQAVKLARILERLEPEHEAVQKLGIRPETARAFESGYNKAGEQRKRYSVPLHTTGGELLGFAGIALEGEQPQIVLGTGIDPLLIFNAHRVDGSDVMIARSVLDLILAVDNGTPIESIIAPLTQPTTSEWLAVVTSFLDERKIESLWL